ncbi:hypothetical protein B0H10DRAFT_1959456 [Mycena sp. CBHHK59/15]|nr:hypothetical protein B0H10DRAFT_1959456 [Mycena sp. CBHHK59/15]
MQTAVKSKRYPPLKFATRGRKTELRLAQTLSPCYCLCAFFLPLPAFTQQSAVFADEDAVGGFLELDAAGPRGFRAKPLSRGWEFRLVDGTGFMRYEVFVTAVAQINVSVADGTEFLVDVR